ncbi:alpha/beta hydrolase [Asaia sp. As-1742]|uniref:alpha/beta hydrolase n=1 Tax=Asaia sp. As-1742 TaxID=2608325 RepID=UPI001F03BC91|nr:alpha/beta hydrolase [Asaia sp. As-1742]
MKRLAPSIALATALAASPALAAPVLEPTTQHFLDGLAAAHVPAIPSLSPHDARALLDSAQGSVKVSAPFARITDRVLPIGPTGSTRVRVYRPANVTNHGPAIVYYHGAGWVMGGPASHDRLARDLAAGSGAVVIFVDYERSPETRYPTAIEQDYAVLTYVAQPHLFRARTRASEQALSMPTCNR